MPDNASYYHAAYVVLAALYAGYTLSIVLRRRALDARRERQHAARHGGRA
jgi:hypothetical protein